MRNVLLVSLGMFIFFLVGMFQSKSTSQPKVSVSVETRIKDEELIGLHFKYRDLNKELSLLNNEGAAQVNVDSVASPVSIRKVYAKEEVDRKVGAMMDFYKSVDPMKASEIIAKGFEVEPEELELKERRESALRQHYINSPEFNKYSVKSIECRSEHCRVEVFYNSLQEVENVVSDINSIVENNDYGPLFYGSAESAVDPQKKTISVYLPLTQESSLYD